MNIIEHTVRVPHIGEELHCWRSKGIVLGKLELGGKNTAFERRTLWPLYQGLPVQ
jgi:hypothetical protein